MAVEINLAQAVVLDIESIKKEKELSKTNSTTEVVQNVLSNDEGFFKKILTVDNAFMALSFVGFYYKPALFLAGIGLGILAKHYVHTQVNPENSDKKDSLEDKLNSTLYDFYSNEVSINPERCIAITALFSLVALAIPPLAMIPLPARVLSVLPSSATALNIMHMLFQILPLQYGKSHGVSLMQNIIDANSILSRVVLY